MFPQACTMEPRFNEMPRDWGKLFVIEGSLYRTPPFNEFSGKLPKCSLYRGIVNN